MDNLVLTGSRYISLKEHILIECVRIPPTSVGIEDSKTIHDESSYLD